MGQQRLNQKQSAAPTRSQPTKTSIKSPVHPVEELQAAIGNQEMGRLMETNRLPHPSSPFPKLQGELPLLGGMMPVSHGTIQRQPLFRGLSQELAADTAKALPATGAVIQPKLTLGTPGDMYEEEADRVARQVVDEIHTSPFREPNKLSPGERKPDGGEALRVQRQITVRAAGDAGGELSSEWEGELQRSKSGGQPLSPMLKEPMERAFGADLGGVRVHTGEQADRLARSIQALAFTTGQDVYFRQGAYEPGSRGGQELIAHELTHVVQQNGGVVGKASFYHSSQASSASPIHPKSILEQPGYQYKHQEELETLNQTGLSHNSAFFESQATIQRKLQGGVVIQPMRFSRFQGLKRIFNWRYNYDENQLLKVENKASELLSELRNYYTGSLRAALPEEYSKLEARLTTVRNSIYTAEEYSSVKIELESIVEEGDRISSKLARTDLPLEEGFDLSQEKALSKDEYGISKNTTLKQVMELVMIFAKKQNLANLVQLRELTDILVQFVNDVVMKTHLLHRHAAVQIKGQLIEASTDIHTAYLLASLKKDMKKAETYYILGTTKLAHESFSSAFFASLSESTKEKAYPKYREASEKPYESGAIMLASAFLKDGFVPDVVIGLPTGGVHAANRFVAAVNIITGKKPLMWTTRPQGVKEESRQFMQGTTEDDIFNVEEIKYLVLNLSKRFVNIAVVDDGFMSGNTLIITKEIYKKRLQDWGIRVDIRTGVIEAGYNQMEEKFNVNDNPADYVVVPCLNMAGKTGALGKEANKKQTKNYGSLEPKSKKEVAILTKRGSFAELTIGDILEGK